MRWSLLFLVLVLAAPVHRCHAAQTAVAKNVLLLYSFTDRKALDSIEVLKSATRSRLGAPVNFQVEYLETQRFETPGYEKGVSEVLAGLLFGQEDRPGHSLRLPGASLCS